MLKYPNDAKQGYLRGFYLHVILPFVKFFLFLKLFNKTWRRLCFVFSTKMSNIKLLITVFCLLTAKRTQRERSSPNPEADTAASAPEWTHLQDTVISTLVAGMLPLIGSKSRTVAVASTLSITSPSMLAGDPGQLPELRESL